jgi:hypothetical protein
VGKLPAREHGNAGPAAGDGTRKRQGQAATARWVQGRFAIGAPARARAPVVSPLLFGGK